MHNHSLDAQQDNHKVKSAKVKLPISRFEFIAQMVFLMSFFGIAIDAILPALGSLSIKINILQNSVITKFKILKKIPIF